MTMALRRIDTLARTASAPPPVIKATALAHADVAHDIVEQARQEASRIVAQAHAQAEGILERERAALDDARKALGDEVWRRIAGYRDAISEEWERSLTELETGLATLAGAAVRRLVGSATAQRRLQACVRQLVAQAGAPDGGVLLIADADHDTVNAVAPQLPWPIQRSADMTPGTVRLVSRHGRWECDIDGALDRMLKALGATTPQPEDHDHDANDH